MQWFSCFLGPFGGVFGLPTQLLRFLSSERPICLCRYSKKNIPLILKLGLGCLNCKVPGYTHGESLCWPIFESFFLTTNMALFRKSKTPGSNISKDVSLLIYVRFLAENLIVEVRGLSTRFFKNPGQLRILQKLLHL